MIEGFVFSWYLLTAAGVSAGNVQAEDLHECEAARHDKSVELSQKIASKTGEPHPGSGWVVGACKKGQ